jgi:hypothetical protein
MILNSDKEAAFGDEKDMVMSSGDMKSDFSHTELAYLLD